MSESNGTNRDGRNEDGTFGKGNPGKPKGAVQKVSVKVKESIFNFLEANIDKIQADFDKLKPRERLQFVADILPYATPKLSATQVDADINAGITIRFADPGDYVYPTQDQSNTGIPESV
jgi:hypothetical protein